MVHARPALPAGHGELVARPDVAEWPALLGANRRAAEAWDFAVAGLPASQMRALARREALAEAAAFSEVLGVAVAAPGEPASPIVATGHQPELYHPGVWVKDFLLQRIAEEVGASAFDVVVDSDGFDAVGVVSPCMTPGVARCKQYLALGTPDTCFACTPVPTEGAVADFCAATDGQLASLPSPAIRRHFASFCTSLTGAVADAGNLAELVTIARRRYEATAGSMYLELPITIMARTESFARFVVDMALSAERFSAVYNGELDQYRSLSKTRSAAQPFPNLGVSAEGLELPLWSLRRGGRDAVWARPGAAGVTLMAAGQVLCDLPMDPDDAVRTLRASGALIAPKALSLTLFVRTFACDLFIHGVGGGRYDRVTDGVIRRYYGVEPPAFVVASLTMYLPLGAHLVTDEEVAAARERLNRLEHNPDSLLSEVEFDAEDERKRAIALAREKRELVSAIASPEADKKALGGRIREVNTELGTLLAPLKQAFTLDLESLELQRTASEILTDRTYPFCFWSPEEVADKAR